MSYTRRASLYRVLTRIAPLRDATGARVGAVVVDVPLEVDYRVNNRFLRSGNIASTLDISPATVSLDYFPVTPALPRSLERLGADARRRRDRLAALRRRLGRRAVPVDSLLYARSWPENVEPVGTVAGSRDGLRARVVVHTREGNPLVGITASGRPLAQEMALRARHRRDARRAALLLALVVAGVLVARRVGRARTRAGRAGRVAAWVAFMALLRAGALSLHDASMPGGGSLFDPAIFATPALGGVLRSVADLLITAAMALVTLYGATRIVRRRDDLATGERVFPDDEPGRVARATTVSLVPAIALVTGASVFAQRFCRTVVENANPRLFGDAMRLTDGATIALHLGTFGVLSALVLAAVFAVWGTVRAAGGGRATLVRTAMLALVPAAALTAWLASPATGAVAVAVVAFIAWAPRFVRREDVVSLVIVAFALVVIVSSLACVELVRDYESLSRRYVAERVDDLLDPSDDWKVVVLEDVLASWTDRADVRNALRAPAPERTRRLAFDLWADSPLSLLGYSCAVHVLDAADSVVSRFEVDMPYRVRLDDPAERTDTPAGRAWAVLDLTRDTPHGIVRFYRGIANVRSVGVPGAGGATTGAGTRETEPPSDARADSVRTLGRVVVDVPFFYADLAMAARTGPRTPSLLRNVQPGTVAPRVEAPDALLLARLRGGRVIESSTTALPVGASVSPSIVDRARRDRWPRLAAAGASWRVTARPTADGEEILVAGYPAPSGVRRVLQSATVFSLYLLFAFAIIVAMVAARMLPRVGRLMPAVTPGRGARFQQKLLGSFLLVALVPAVVVGAFGYGFIRDRVDSESRREAYDDAIAARSAMAGVLASERSGYLERVDLDSLFAPGTPATWSPAPGRRVLRVADTGDVLAQGEPPIDVAGTMHEPARDAVLVLRRGREAWAGVVGAPVEVSDPSWSGRFYLMYARRLDGDLLAAVSEPVGADVNAWIDGELAASSRDGLLAGGFIAGVMNARAWRAVSLLRASHYLDVERAGDYRYHVAWVPLPQWSFDDGRMRPDSVRAALGVPLLFRPEAWERDVQRATSMLLGMFALLFIATMAVGLLLARGIFEPLRALLGGTVRVARGDFDVRLSEERDDEIGTVMRAFNDMSRAVARSRDELESRRRYLEAILQNIATGVIGVDAEGRIRTVNAAARRILGDGAGALEGRPVTALADVGAHALAGAFDGDGEFVAGEVELERGQERATVKYMLTRLSGAERDAPGAGAVLVFEDLTELIRTKKLAAWVEMARQIAHEIKNPLTPIRISTQVMQRAWTQRRDEFDAIFRESTEQILRQVDILKRIAGEFSSFGRLQRLERVERDVGECVREIVAGYGGDDGRVTFVDESGGALARIDADALRKVVANLVENALEATGGAGPVHVRCAFDADAREVVVTVRDHGPGLSSEAAERLFEPYFSTKTTGTGLGLAICRTLVEDMGGFIEVANAPEGGGVVATVRLGATSGPTGGSRPPSSS